MYSYNFSLKPANKHSNINYVDISELITNSIISCNQGVTYTRDSKEIELIAIEPNQIQLKLHCKTPLANASRSLSALSRELLKNNANVFADSIYNKTLFSIQLLNEQHSFSDESLSDPDLIKAIVDLLYTYTATTPADAEKRNSTINQIKTLVAPYYKR